MNEIKISEIKEMIQNIIKLIDEKIPTVCNPQTLIFLKKRYQTALTEIDSFNTIRTDLDWMVRIYFEEYSDSTNNPLIDEMRKLERIIRIQITKRITYTGQCDTRIKREILNGEKIPHSTSQPVIRIQDGKPYLAVFVFFYTREDIKSGMINRPTVWALADIQTGEIIKEYNTVELEFSDAPYDVKYNVRSDKKYDTSREYYDKAFAILDSVREKILKTGELDLSEYKEYLDMILANIPEDYQRFYRDLSV